MLKELAIENYAIFENLSVEFDRGLNVLTGETGAGKSLLVGAIGLLLGIKADKSVIRLGKDLARIQATFFVEPELAGEMRSLGVEIDADELIFAREISLSGRSKFFIGGRQASASLLGESAKKLVQIYGQSEHQTLLVSQKHTFILDEFSQAADLFAKYREAYQKVNEIKSKLAELDKRSQELESRADYLRFVISEIERVSPKIREDEEIEAKRERVKFSSRLKELGEEAEKLIYSKANSATETLGKARDIALEAKRIDPQSFEKIVQDTELALSIVEETGHRLSAILDSLDFDSDELDRISERWDEINRLKRKYGGTIERVLDTLEHSKKELSTLERSSFDRRQLETALADATKEAERIADALTQKRKKGAIALERWMRSQLKDLALENAELKVELIAEDGLGHFGKERARFLFAPNPGEGFRELELIASGGELSRLMLALKTAAARMDSGLVLVFDEVDAGIGGRVAECVGGRLKSIASAHQVLVVTHQAQIAKFADKHISVQKEVKGERTFGLARELSKSERERELARMIVGEKITDKALLHAKEMLKSVKSHKGDRLDGEDRTL